MSAIYNTIKWVPKAIIWTPTIICSISIVKTIFGIRNNYLEIDQKLSQEIKSEFTDFLNKHNFKKNIDFIVLKPDRFNLLTGITAECTTFNRKIYISSEILQKYPEVARYLIKHELGHIKNNDSILIALTTSISAISSGILFANLKYNPITCFFPYLIASFTNTFFTRYREKKADDFANINSSDKELIAVASYRRAYCTREYIRNEFYKDNLFKTFKFYIRDLFSDHPDEFSRLKKIEKEYFNRTKTPIIEDKSRESELL